MTLEEKVTSIVVDSLHADAAQVKPEASFVDDLGADSLDLAELMMNVEDAFKPYMGDKTISDEEQAQIKTVGALVELLKSKGAPAEL